MVYLSSSPPLRMLVQRISDINVRFVQESTPGQDRRLPGNFKWISTCPTLAAPIDIPMQTMQVFRHIYSSKLLLSRRTCWTWQAIWNCYKDKQVDCCLATSTNWLGSCSSNWDHLFSVTWTEWLMSNIWIWQRCRLMMNGDVIVHPDRRRRLLSDPDDHENLLFQEEVKWPHKRPGSTAHLQSEFIEGTSRRTPEFKLNKLPNWGTICELETSDDCFVKIENTKMIHLL